MRNNYLLLVNPLLFFSLFIGCSEQEIKLNESDTISEREILSRKAKEGMQTLEDGSFYEGR